MIIIFVFLRIILVQSYVNNVVTKQIQHQFTTNNWFALHRPQQLQQLLPTQQMSNNQHHKTSSLPSYWCHWHHYLRYWDVPSNTLHSLYQCKTVTFQQSCHVRVSSYWQDNLWAIWQQQICPNQIIKVTLQSTCKGFDPQLVFTNTNIQLHPMVYLLKPINQKGITTYTLTTQINLQPQSKQLMMNLELAWKTITFFWPKTISWIEKTLQECNIKKYDMIIMTSQHGVCDDPQHDAGSVNSINYSDSVLITILDLLDVP